MRRPRAAVPLDRRYGVRPKAKRLLRAMRRAERGEVYDDRFPDTSRGEKLVQLHRALKRRRAKNKVAKQSRKVNR